VATKNTWMRASGAAPWLPKTGAQPGITPGKNSRPSLKWPT